MVPKWIIRTAVRKSELFGQIAKAFCRSRQLNRNPARGASQSGFCGCQTGVIFPEIGKMGATDDDCFSSTASGLSSETGIEGRSFREVQA